MNNSELSFCDDEMYCGITCGVICDGVTNGDSCLSGNTESNAVCLTEEYEMSNVILQIVINADYITLVKQKCNYVIKIKVNELTCPVLFMNNNLLTNKSCSFKKSILALFKKINEKKTATMILQNNFCGEICIYSFYIYDTYYVTGSELILYGINYHNDSSLQKIIKKFGSQCEIKLGASTLFMNLLDQ